jgi:hypothetical protein
MDGDSIKLYKLVRKLDVNKMSGTGVVALIAVMPSGRAIMEWIASNHPTISIFNNLEEITLIHGHNGASVVESMQEPKKRNRNVKKS